MLSLERICAVVIKTTQVLKVNVALTVIPYAEPRAMNNNIEGGKKIYHTQSQPSLATPSSPITVLYRVCA